MSGLQKQITYRYKLSLIRLRRHARRIGHGRLSRLGVASLILFSAFLPAFNWLDIVSRYQLSSTVQGIVGPTNPNLDRKFTFDPMNNMWQFNKEGQAVRAAQIATAQGTDAAGVGQALQQLQAQVGGGGKNDTSLYSVNLPAKAEQGMTVFDNQTSQSFSMVPLFKSGEGKLWQGRIVYPFGEGGQIVYTAKTNGIKEDIILNKFVSESMQFDYQLKLPSTLEARLQEDGSLGIFSADPALYSNITYGSDADRAKVDSARQTAQKTHLVFAVPAPVVIDHTGERDTAAYSLRDNVLTVAANRLDKLSYPLSIDPSVVVTSTSDFKRGNDEGMIDYDTDGQITRSRVSGGSLNTFTSGNTTGYNGRIYNSTVAYNGYLYQLGGAKDGGASNLLTFMAPINADGSLGNWTTTTNLLNERLFPSAVAYNGYMYVYGGLSDGGTNPYNTVDFAPINTNGTLGAWTRSTNTLLTSVCDNGYAAYNGYLYAFGGVTGGSSGCGDLLPGFTANVQYAPILANGNVGAWSTTTALPAGRGGMSTAIVNGYVYIAAGGTSAATTSVNVYYAKVRDNGTIGAWNTGPSLPEQRARTAMVAAKGYLYLTGGAGNSNTTSLMSRVNADGSLDTWQTTSNIITARYSHGMAYYNNRVYIAGGANTAVVNTIDTAALSAPGAIAGAQTATALPTALTNGYSFTYNARMYYVGGLSGSTPQTTTRIATMNATGNYNAWSTTTAMANASYGGGFGISSSRLYIMGGVGSNIVQYTSFNSGGAMGTWATTTNLPYACGNHSGTSYNGYVYYICGSSGDGATTDVLYAPINSDGTIGTWVTTSSLTTSVSNESMIVHAGYVYVIGGQNGATYRNTVQYAKINNDGTFGTFANTTSMQESAANSGVYVQNGYMYRAGGENTAALSSVEYASINANGTLNSWVSALALPQTVTRAGITQGGDRLFTLGGLVNGTAATTVYSVLAGSGGGGTGAWVTGGNTLATPYPNGIYEHMSFVYKNYMYIVGGRNNTDGRLAQTWSAPIDDYGTVGAWTQQSSMNVVRSGFVLAQSGDYVYAYTGRNNTGNSYNSYSYAQLGPNGSLGAWTAEAPMSMATGTVPVRQLAAGGAFNGKLYVFAGQTQAAQGDVNAYYAPINADGSVGTWVQTSNINTGRQAPSAVFYNGYAYVLGGSTANNGTALADVQFAKINSDGSLQPWQFTASTPTARAFGFATVYNGRLYVYTGSGGSLTAQNVQSATISPSGELSTWDSSSGQTFTPGRYSASGVAYQGRVYMTGGIGSGSANYNDTQMSALLTVPRISRYSVLVDIGALLTIRSVSYQGSSHDGMSIRYRTAPVNGVLGAFQTGTAGAGTEPTPGCGENDGTRYVWIQTTMDDTLYMTYGAESSQSNITSINMFYSLSVRSAPQQRLFGGKSFQQEKLISHDTCG